MSVYAAEWRRLQDARDTKWRHRADRRGWCRDHRESGVWVRAGECIDYLQAQQTIDLIEQKRVPSSR